jgi:succinyl-diaminopimelate desuccinylase
MAFTPDADFPLIHIEKGHYHPDFGAQWESSDAKPRVAALTGGFRTNVVLPRPRPWYWAFTPTM